MSSFIVETNFFVDAKTEEEAEEQVRSFLNHVWKERDKESTKGYTVAWSAEDERE